MMRVLTIGGATRDTFLCCSTTNVMDITIQQQSGCFMLFEADQKMTLDQVAFKCGGGALNTAIAFRRLGHTAECFCKLGTDEVGTSIMQTLQHENVITRSIVQSTSEQSGQSFIITNRRGEHTIFTLRGANATITEHELPLDAIATSDLIYVTSLSNQSLALLDVVAARAAQHHIPLVLNPGMSQLTSGIHALTTVLPHTRTLILNASEARICMIALMKHEPRCIKKSFSESCTVASSNGAARLLIEPLYYDQRPIFLQEFMRTVRNLGTEIVIVTDGAHGVYLAHGNSLLFHPSFRVPIVDTTGAGDAFGATFTALYYDGAPIPYAFHGAMTASSSVIQHLGAQTGLATKSALATLMARSSSTIEHMDL